MSFAIFAPLFVLAIASPDVGRADVVTLTPDQQVIIDHSGRPAGADGKQYGIAKGDALGDEVILPLGGSQVSLLRTDSTLLDDGSISWIGRVKETGERAVLMGWGSSLLSGYFAYNGTIYAVENLGGGVHAFAELGRGKDLSDHPEARGRPDSISASAGRANEERPSPAEPAVRELSDSDRTALEAKHITIDVMLLYTANVAKRYVRDPSDLLVLSIEEVNATFRNSGLSNINLRLVHTQAIDYDTSADDQFTHLYAMVDGLGPFKGVKALRNEKHADIVGLIIDNPNGCGLSTRVGPDSDEAFFVVHHACATITMSVAHEIGHILGIRHDRYVDESNVPLAYGHGYVNGNKWRDIMSYNEGCGGCPRIPFWSNPRITYKGDRIGTPAADSARVILEMAERVSKFR